MTTDRHLIVCAAPYADGVGSRKYVSIRIGMGGWMVWLDRNGRCGLVDFSAGLEREMFHAGWRWAWGKHIKATRRTNHSKYFNNSELIFFLSSIGRYSRG